MERRTRAPESSDAREPTTRAGARSVTPPERPRAPGRLERLGLPHVWGADIESAWTFMRWSVAPATMLLAPGSVGYGLDLMPESGGAVLAANRFAAIDPPLVGSFSRRRRGGEEAIALAEAGVPFEVVPGVSSVSAVPAAAGIPITHRGVSAQVTVVAGHAPDRLDFEQLAATPGTLIVFMGLGHLDRIVEGLIDAGRDPETRAAVVESGTLPEQRVVTAPLAELVGAALTLSPPALVVVGDVVALAEAIQPGHERLLSRA